MVSTLDSESSDPSSNLGGTCSVFFLRISQKYVLRLRSLHLVCCVYYHLDSVFEKLKLNLARKHSFDRPHVDGGQDDSLFLLFFFFFGKMTAFPRGVVCCWDAQDGSRGIEKIQ